VQPTWAACSRISGPGSPACSTPAAPGATPSPADSADAKGGAHVAFRAADHRSVDRFYAAGLAAGGRDNGKPGLRPDYSPTYYAAFLVDPDGNNVEAVCLD
jgi:catechol 2,3-dioxygenase-like lactoylglutathione lyase family enzyme